MAVTRSYICDKCDYSFTIQESIKIKPKRKCPKCYKLALYQDLTGGQQALVTQEATTLGQQAERNSKAMGKYGVEEQTKIDNANKNKYLTNSRKSWYNPTGQNLKEDLKDVLTHPDKIKKYILEGKQ